jgi:hypothetical protein
MIVSYALVVLSHYKMHKTRVVLVLDVSLNKTVKIKQSYIIISLKVNIK